MKPPFPQNNGAGYVKRVFFGIIVLFFAASVGFCQAQELSQPSTFTTDKNVYAVGDTVASTVKNNSAQPMQYRGSCAFAGCSYRKGEWWCENKECHAAIVTLAPGESLTIYDAITDCNGLCSVKQKKKFTYEDASATDGFGTLYSNEFMVTKEAGTEKGAMNKEKAIAIAKAYALKKGEDLADYKEPTATYDEAAKTWDVSFVMDPMPPGGSFDVIVHGETGEVLEFFPGE